MVTMAESAANWRNTHTHVDRTHSLTHLHHHSYNHIVRKRQLSYYIIWNRILFLKVGLRPVIYKQPGYSLESSASATQTY